MYEILAVAIRLVLGLVIGFLIGMTGVGGGVLGLQAMRLVVGLDPVMAVGTTSLYIFLTNISAVTHHARLRTIDYTMVGQMLAGAVPGVVVMSLWISRHGGDLAFETALHKFILAAVFVAVAVMGFNLMATWRGRVANSGNMLVAYLTAHRRMRVMAALVAGGGVGALVGATSVGGGVLVVPILVLVFGLTASRTVGSSVTITLVLTLAVSLIFGHRGALDTHTAVTMALGSLVGVPLGSRLAVRVPEFVLQAVIVVVIAVAAVMMISS